MQEGLRLLQGQLAGEVGARQEELLGQAARLAAAEAAFSGSALAVTSLQAALHRVRAEITDPYREASPPPLQNLQLGSTSDVARLQSGLQPNQLQRRSNHRKTKFNPDTCSYERMRDHRHHFGPDPINLAHDAHHHIINADVMITFTGSTSCCTWPPGLYVVGRSASDSTNYCTQGLQQELSVRGARSQLMLRMTRHCGNYGLAQLRALHAARDAGIWEVAMHSLLVTFASSECRTKVIDNRPA